MTSPSQDRLYGANSSLAFKAPVKAATTANITLSGEQTIDGVSIVSGDRVLVKDQTTASQNGIYIADTSTWERAPDFDGNRDVAQGTRVYVNSGSANASSEWVLSTANPITIDTTSLSFSRTDSNYITKTSSTASAGQTAFTVATYQTGANAIEVYVNGIRQRLTDDYTESSTTGITFTYALASGDEVDTYSSVPGTSVSSAVASAVSVSDAGDYWVGTTVEAILQEMAGGVSADNGDADVTYTNASSSRVQRWNTALTANRTLTLSTSSAKEGAWVIAVRGAGATGNFTLSVGSLATLRAPGEWAKCVYDAGTAAWVLVGYGILPSAEIMALSADKGNADATLTVGTSERTARWSTTLTVDRTATLSTTGAYTGARFRIIRTESATGNFSLIVAGTATLIRLAVGQWCDVEYTGSAWIVVASGDIARDPNTNVITLFDDFLGEEVDAYKWQSLIGTNATCQQAIVAQDQARGLLRLTTGADAGGTMALNGCQLQSALNWSANQGGLVFEARVLMSAITDVVVFLGLTDQVSALECPFTLSGTTLTSNATDAVGVLFDTAATTDDWWLVGVAADVDATKQDAGVAPTASTMETWRIEISATGVATFYRNGSLIGSAMTGAVTASVVLTPVVAAFARGAASRTIDADFISVQAQR